MTTLIIFSDWPPLAFHTVLSKRITENIMVKALNKTLGNRVRNSKNRYIEAGVMVK